MLARQDAHFAVMASTMTREAKNFYGSYFTRYRKYLSGISREIVTHKLENALIYETFNGALMDVYPRTVYKYARRPLISFNQGIRVRGKIIVRYVTDASPGGTLYIIYYSKRRLLASLIDWLRNLLPCRDGCRTPIPLPRKKQKSPILPSSAVHLS